MSWRRTLDAPIAQPAGSSRKTVGRDVAESTVSTITWTTASVPSSHASRSTVCGRAKPSPTGGLSQSSESGSTSTESTASDVTVTVPTPVVKGPGSRLETRAVVEGSRSETEAMAEGSRSAPEMMAEGPRSETGPVTEGTAFRDRSGGWRIAFRDGSDG